MKINLRTINQALSIGQKLMREWNKYQNQKDRQQGTAAPKTTRSKTTRETKRQGDYGTFGTEPAQQRPAESTQGQSPAVPSNPYATGTTPPPATSSNTGSWETGGYPGDYFGTVTFDYSPNPDGEADPGEVVWAWVPFEEDYTQGKDRPLLIIGKSGNYLLGLMLTSKDHTNAATTDPNYLDIGSGAWDKEGRPSEVKLNRVIQLNPRGLRREGATMDRATFDLVVQAYNQR
ncbi:type II toxin-antitoxin system PemK/MazF family toxin [Rothia sp. P5766]|uniref:type II toxin-antitoxin system PemK/MazF family toxin n=1 Tax=Rothia sp. P5766 TaxID=3402656 RepID=UPI003AE9DDA2